MPRAKPKPNGRAKGVAKAPTKSAKRVKSIAKAAAKPAKPKAAAEIRTLNGLPLKSKTIWVFDTDSAQFKAARKRDAEALKSGDADGMQHIEGLFVDKEVQKWWT